MTKVMLCFLMLTMQLDCKILIMTQAHNRPEFIILQKKALDTFIADDFEYVVFNDAKDPEMKKQIQAVCEKLKIRFCEFPQVLHEWPYTPRQPNDNFYCASARNCNVVQFSFDILGFKKNDIVITMDADLFPIKTFNIREFMKNTHIAGRKMNHPYPYLWIGMIMIDMSTAPNKYSLDVNAGAINKIWIDSGGYTYYYLTQNPTLNVKYIDVIPTINLICYSCKMNHNINVICTHNKAKLLKYGFQPDEIQLIQQSPMHKIDQFKNFEFLLDKHFIHYGASSMHGPLSLEHHRQKTELLTNFIENRIKAAS